MEKIKRLMEASWWENSVGEKISRAWCLIAWRKWGGGRSLKYYNFHYLEYRCINYRRLDYIDTNPILFPGNPFIFKLKYSCILFILFMGFSRQEYWSGLPFPSPVGHILNSMKRQKDRTLKDELPRLVGAQYATGDQWRTNSRKNEEMEPKQKQHPAVDVTGDGSRVCAVKNNIA